MHASGARAWSQGRAEDLLTQAEEHLHAATPTPRAAAELTALARLATHRDY